MTNKKQELIKAFKKENICCVHNDGDDTPCNYTTNKAIEIIEKVYKKNH